MEHPKDRILVADEDPLSRLQVHRLLDDLGWDVMAVNTGEEAIRVVEMGMQVDVLLTELRLPDLDGQAVAWGVSRLRRRARIAFMGSVVPEASLEPNGAPFLLKPFSARALAKALVGAVSYPR